MIAALLLRCGSSVINHKKSFGSIGGPGYETPSSAAVGVVTSVRRGARPAFNLSSYLEAFELFKLDEVEGSRPSVRDSAPPKSEKSVKMWMCQLASV